jgi:hypothetical protein
MKFQSFEKPTTDSDFSTPKTFDQTVYRIVTFSKEPIPDEKTQELIIGSSKLLSSIFSIEKGHLRK